MLAECVADVISDAEHGSVAELARLGRPSGRPSLPLSFSYQRPQRGSPWCRRSKQFWPFRRSRVLLQSLLRYVSQHLRLTSAHCTRYDDVWGSRTTVLRLIWLRARV